MLRSMRGEPVCALSVDRAEAGRQHRAENRPDYIAFWAGMAVAVLTALISYNPGAGFPTASRW
jgi:hypothetical protein